MFHINHVTRTQWPLRWPSQKQEVMYDDEARRTRSKKHTVSKPSWSKSLSSIVLRSRLKHLTQAIAQFDKSYKTKITKDLSPQRTPQNTFEMHTILSYDSSISPFRQKAGDNGKELYANANFHRKAKEVLWNALQLVDHYRTASKTNKLAQKVWRHLNIPSSLRYAHNLKWAEPLNVSQATRDWLYQSSLADLFEVSGLLKRCSEIQDIPTYSRFDRLFGSFVSGAA